MSSFNSIFGGYTQNNLSPVLNEWEKIISHYGSSINENDVWKIARCSETFPQIENIYQALVLNCLESIFIEQINGDWDDVEFFSFINCYDTHFSINGEAITEEQHFYNKIEEVKKELKKNKIKIH